MKKLLIVVFGIVILFSACLSLPVEKEAIELAESGHTISAAVSTLQPVPSPTQASAPSLFDNADVTLNGCNNKSVAAADGILYISCIDVQLASDLQTEPMTWHLLDTYDLSTGLPGRPLIQELQDDFGWIGYSFICAYNGSAYFSVEAEKGFSVERIGMDGISTVLYQAPEKPEENNDNINDDYWQAGKYLFYNYFPPRHPDTSVLIRINMETGEYINIQNSGLLPNEIKAYDGQYIYFLARNNLYRMDLDCKNEVCLVPEVYSNYLLASGGRVYYLQHGTKITSVGTDGKDKREIADIDMGGSFVINIAYGYIYYTNPSDNWKLYRMKTDGTEKQIIGISYSDIQNIDVAAGRLFVYYWSSNGAHIVTMLPDGSDVVDLY